MKAKFFSTEEKAQEIATVFNANLVNTTATVHEGSSGRFFIRVHNGGDFEVFGREDEK